MEVLKKKTQLTDDHSAKSRDTANHRRRSAASAQHSTQRKRPTRARAEARVTVNVSKSRSWTAAEGATMPKSQRAVASSTEGDKEARGGKGGSKALPAAARRAKAVVTRERYRIHSLSNSYPTWEMGPAEKSTTDAESQRERSESSTVVETQPSSTVGACVKTSMSRRNSMMILRLPSMPGGDQPRGPGREARTAKSSSTGLCRVG
mmetsp:Transcript_66634/g.185774  ORF Transcript_66634/g.185774 Transcript_66634/m.185774 type:complete len:206 (+) Transcript_66634:225-842(+)